MVLIHFCDEDVLDASLFVVYCISMCNINSILQNVKIVLTNERDGRIKPLADALAV